MRQLLLALAIAAAAGCSADSAPGGDAATRAPDAGAATTADATPPAAPEASPMPPAPNQVTTVPARFQGEWALDAAACAFPGHESHLTIDADRIQFHESGGTVTSVSQSGAELTVVVNLSGEGQTREASYRFQLSEDGNTLTDLSSGAAMVRHRC